MYVRKGAWPQAVTSLLKLQGNEAVGWGFASQAVSGNTSCSSLPNIAVSGKLKCSFSIKSEDILDWEASPLLLFLRNIKYQKHRVYFLHIAPSLIFMLRLCSEELSFSGVVFSVMS